MAEFTAVAVQTVDARQNIIYTDTPVAGGKCIYHREGSGVVTLRGITNQCRARFRVMFTGNIAVPAAGTVAPISVAIAINGEPLQSSIATVTPAAVEDVFNVALVEFVEVPANCCLNVAVENTSTEAITVQNASFIVERVA